MLMAPFSIRQRLLNGRHFNPIPASWLEAGSFVRTITCDIEARASKTGDLDRDVVAAINWSEALVEDTRRHHVSRRQRNEAAEPCDLRRNFVCHELSAVVLARCPRYPRLHGEIVRILDL